MSNGQREFIADYVDKLNAAVERINELSGNTDQPEPPEPETPSDGQSCANGGLIGGICGGVGALIIIAAVIVVLRLRKKNTVNNSLHNEDEIREKEDENRE